MPRTDRVSRRKKDRYTDAVTLVGRELNAVAIIRPVRGDNLVQMMPRAGMKYENSHQINRKKKADARIAGVLRGYFEKKLETEELDEVLGKVFLCAAEFVQAHGTGWKKKPHGPLAFINKVWQVLLLSETTKWVRGMGYQIFQRFFITVRAARLNWLKDPRAAVLYGQDEPCLLAKSIDTFEEFSEGKIAWISDEMIRWLRTQPFSFFKKWMAKAGGMSAEGVPVPMDGENADGSKIKAETSEDDDMLQGICKQLKELGLDVSDKDGLAEMFGKLSLEKDELVEDEEDL